MDTTLMIPVVIAALLGGGLAYTLWAWGNDRRALSELRIEKARIEEQARAVQNATEAVQRTFESLAAEALKSNSEAFLGLAKSKLEEATKDATRGFERETESVKKLVEPLQKSLEKYEQQLQGLELRRQRAFTEIEQGLRAVVEQSVEVARQASGLKSALTKSHVRGRWGEVQLRNCVELAGMSEYCDLSFQDSSRTNDDELVRPDMTVRMPAGRTIVVDAKAPLASFEAYVDATTDDQRNAALLQHGRHTRQRVDELSKKEYWEKVAGSPDFVVLFLPNESFLYAALETQRDLMEYAMERRVLIASPPSLVGLLKVIRYGWMEQRMAEDAQKIAAEGREFHKRIAEFMTNFVNLGKALERVNREFHAADYNLRSKIAVTAKRLEELGAKGPKAMPELAVAALPTDAFEALDEPAPAVEVAD